MKKISLLLFAFLIMICALMHKPLKKLRSKIFLLMGHFGRKR